MKRKNCHHCQGEQTDSICVNIEHEEFFTLDEFIEDSSEKLEELTKEPDIDLKGLVNCSKDLTRDEIIQILVDKVSDLTKEQTYNNSGSIKGNSLINCNLDWSPIENCNDCSPTECDKFQVLINKVGKLLEKNDIW